MRLFLLILLAFLSNFCFGQVDTVFAKVEIMPAIEDCLTITNSDEKNNCTLKKIFKHLKKVQKYPVEAKRKKIQGIVYVSFIIDKKGQLIDIKVIKGVSESRELDEEAVRMIESLNQLNWIPGYHNGEPVKVLYTIPIQFSL